MNLMRRVNLHVLLLLFLFPLGTLFSVPVLLGQAPVALTPVALTPVALTSAAPSAAHASQAVLNQALKACRKGDYKAGKRGFEEWLRKHPEGNGRVEYNLGNCEYRLGKPARALWHWKRAGRRLGHSPQITHNIALIQRQLSLPPEDQAGLFQEFKTYLTQLRPSDYWRLSFLFEVPAIVLLLLYLRRRRPLLFILGLLLYLPALGAAQKATQTPSLNPLGVVVLQDDLPLRTEPRPSLPPTARLPKGLSIPLLTQTPDWLKIRYGHTEAWVPRSGVGLW